MAVKVVADRWAQFHKGPGKKTKGRERKGYQAANLLRAMTEERERILQRPRVERARIAVESMRVVGPDDLTARDEATYQFLLSYAREDGFEKEVHCVDVAKLQAFLDVRDMDGRGRKPTVNRVVESFDRLARTTVRYSFLDEDEGIRRRATVPLVIAETVERLKDGTAFIEYSIPFALRRVMLEATDYVMLEINAFPRFRCKYSPRLYQRLAVLARADDAVRRPWEIAPQDLAEQLGWKSKGAFHAGAFFRDCLTPAVEEINRHVHEFKVRMTKVLGKGRGSPVEKVVFGIETRRIRHRMEWRAAPLTFAEVKAIKEGGGLPESERPSVSAVARAVTMTGLSSARLLGGWRGALRTARLDPEYRFGQFEASMLFHILRMDGADAAFWEWARAQAEMHDSPPRPAVPAPARDSGIAISEVKAERPSPPRPQAFTLRRPAPPAPVQVEKEPDPFDVNARVLETADEIPF